MLMREEQRADYPLEPVFKYKCPPGLRLIFGGG